MFTSTEPEKRLDFRSYNHMHSDEKYNNRISIMNYGYDVIEWRSNCVAITDE